MVTSRPAMRVALVGRPNVGKSTLFNRLVGRKLALVDDLPGVTRDRREGDARLGDLSFTVFDTAGLDEAAPDTLAGRMRAQTEAAVATATGDELPLRLGHSWSAGLHLSTLMREWQREPRPCPLGPTATR